MTLLRFFLPFLIIFTIAIQAHSADSKTDGTGYQSGNKDLQKAEKLIDKKEYAKAAKLLKKITTNNQENADAWNLYGFSLRKSGDTTTARSAYDKALTLDPGHLGANSYLGELFIQIGDLNAAKTQLQKLKHLCPQGCEEQNELERAIAAAS